MKNEKRVNLLTTILYLICILSIVITFFTSNELVVKILVSLLFVIAIFGINIMRKHSIKKIRIDVRKDKIDFLRTLKNEIEQHFSDHIMNKEIINEELIEYKYYFKSPYIEFTLYFDDYFIAYFEKYSKRNHYHFSSWDYGEPYKYMEESIPFIIEELSDLLNGGFLFGDVFDNEDKFQFTFFIDILHRNENESNKLEDILDEFFDEKRFLKKKEYKLKLYGSKLFGEIEIIRSKK